MAIIASAEGRFSFAAGGGTDADGGRTLREGATSASSDSQCSQRGVPIAFHQSQWPQTMPISLCASLMVGGPNLGSFLSTADRAVKPARLAGRG